MKHFKFLSLPIFNATFASCMFTRKFSEFVDNIFTNRAFICNPVFCFKIVTSVALFSHLLNKIVFSNIQKCHVVSKEYYKPKNVFFIFGTNVH